VAGVLLGFAAAAALPFVLFGGVLAAVLKDPRWSDLGYLSGLTPWVLLGAGMLFMVPVVATKGVSPESRFYPRARGAYIGWGTVLYVLGFLLAWQVWRIYETGMQ
jgi:uncharacterized membrane protein